MNDELDPKLREFEAKLRRLKPFCEDGRRLELDGSRQTADGSRFFSRYSGVLLRYALPTAAAIVLAVVYLIPQPHPAVCRLPTADFNPPSAVNNEPSTVFHPPSAVCRLPSATLRQQLAQLLDEMTVANPVAETKPEYQVVEIVVCNSPAPRVVAPSFGQMRFRGDESNFSYF